eukprot:CAMPEP_0184301494 /NCGR_PEP_ID=MMETSP1049-20130417/11681_1 /TAXON_ID=77928 /ORGANISM="Proteomonas sulcata, Strain CCMP704" /LENGTH=107 /DNA_ID=CAMNT_0026612511 /DNA_START=190 /DNA_END=513 /DNA_ORIENTATION=-
MAAVNKRDPQMENTTSSLRDSRFISTTMTIKFNGILNTLYTVALISSGTYLDLMKPIDGQYIPQIPSNKQKQNMIVGPVACFMEGKPRQIAAIINRSLSAVTGFGLK